MGIITGFWNLFFLPRCTFCRKILPLGTELTLCEDCMTILPFAMEKPRCKACGKPVEEGETHCDFCRKLKTRPYTKLTAPYLYREPVRSSVLRFKHEKYQRYATVYAHHMQAVLRYDCPDVPFDVVISAPPRKERMRKIGYDQAACLAKALAKELGLFYLSGAMAQKQERKRQSSLPRGSRMKNVKDNIRVCRAKELQGKVVLVVDDICTTRATFLECAYMLKDSGVKKVYGISAATVE